MTLLTGYNTKQFQIYKLAAVKFKQTITDQHCI